MGPISDNYPTTIAHPINPQAKEKISAVFEFTLTRRLVKVFLNSENDQDQLVLQRGIERLVRPSYLSWIRRLFR
jgi:hypothetical protein